jgi:hypothetical protein
MMIGYSLMIMDITSMTLGPRSFYVKVVDLGVA